MKAGASTSTPRRSARSGHAVSGEQRRGHALTADSHRSEADDRQEEQNRDTRGSAGVRVYTSTGSDLTVDAPRAKAAPAQRQRQPGGDRHDRRGRRHQRRQ
ncbi:hypothetical protein M8494_29520 [Serratia ureilytica]